MIDSSRTLVLYRDMLAFSVVIALTLVCTQGHAHNYVFESHALIGQCLNSWRVTLSYTERIARSILPSFPYYNTLGNMYFY